MLLIATEQNKQRLSKFVMGIFMLDVNVYTYQSGKLKKNVNHDYMKNEGIEIAIRLYIVEN